MSKRPQYVLKWPIFFYNLFAIILNVSIIYKMFYVKFNKNDFTLCSNIRANDADPSSKEVSFFC
jgi:hypothetical protein